MTYNEYYVVFPSVVYINIVCALDRSLLDPICSLGFKESWQRVDDRLWVQVSLSEHGSKLS